MFQTGRLIALLAILPISSSIFGQVTVRLKIDTTKEAFVLHSLFCDKNYKCGLFSDEKEKRGVFGNMPLFVKRDGRDFRIAVDTNGRQGLTGEKKVKLPYGGKVTLWLRKDPSRQRRALLPFEFSHERETEKDGRVVDSFAIRPHFLLTGKFRSLNCSLDITFNDMNANGKFDLTDGGGGSNLGIDRNSDGKFWGRSEFQSTNEIIELCGQNYLVTALSNFRVVLKPTDLKLAKISEKVGSFSFDLLDGKKISSDQMQGRVYILDFWASWCAPCVANLSHLNTLKTYLKDSVKLFSINVDDAKHKNLAEKIIQEKHIGDYSSVRGQGDDDPLWKTFGGTNLNRLAIPLYVLIDEEGVVRYAANGGDDLVDLKNAVQKVLEK